MLTRPALLIPVAVMNSAIEFFVDGLGAELKFRDGDAIVRFGSRN